MSTNEKIWGRPWGDTPWQTDDGREVRMRRHRNRVRFFTASGEQVGPEHANVVSAIVWAVANGWTDPTTPAWLAREMRAEIAAGGIKRRPK